MKTTGIRKTILLLFFASGISGLMYEVVWLRMLSRITGVTTYATAVTLAAFMAGLSLGSLIFGAYVDKYKHPLKLYGLLQFLVAFTALITPLLLKVSLPIYKVIYDLSGQSSGLVTICRILIPSLVLLLPTTLMGGTLPVLTCYLVRRDELFGKSFSLLYGINTLGAVLGVLASGFVTIGFIGEWGTIHAGVLINLVVGIAAYALHRRESRSAVQAPITKEVASAGEALTISPYPAGTRTAILAAILISGFTALSYEVIWSRQLIFFLGTSIYAFSAMLAVFLTGIALGSVSVNRFVDRAKTPLFIFGGLEVIVGLLSLAGLYLYTILDSSTIYRLCSPIILVLPLTFLFGAIFPVASLCYARSADKIGVCVGTLYSFNAIGNVFGSLLTGLLLISVLGSSNTIILLGFINIGLGIILIWLEPHRSRGPRLCSLLGIPFAVLLSLGFIGRDPFLDLLDKRISRWSKHHEMFFNRETREGTITAFSAHGSKWLFINGVGQTTLSTETKLMAHLPMMLANKPKSLLVICFGMGTTVRSAALYDDLNITAVDLIPDLFECSKYYHDDAEKFLTRKGVNTVGEDGRNFLLLSSETWDIITVDPSPPIYSAGAVNLYTKEFFTLCKEHLSDDGIMCLWFPRGIPAAGATEEDSVYILSTFRSVFRHMTVWKGPHGAGLYIIGARRRIDIDEEKIKRAFEDPKIVKDLTEYDNYCSTSAQLLNLLILTDENIDLCTNPEMIITDNYPYTEFMLWRRLSARMKQRRTR